MSNINIGHKDVIWSFIATFLQLGTGVILMPFILHYFPSETFAIWTIFSTIIALTILLDMGFNQSFARNISYVISGAKELKKTGFQQVETSNPVIDFSLLKGIIVTMKWFYARLAIILFILLITAGSYYIYTVAHSYNGEKMDIYISWAILSIINSYSLYTFYYDSVMQGKGMMKQVKQIQIAGQSVYLLVAIALILLKFNLIAVVSAQVLSIITRRSLSYLIVFTKDFKQQLAVESKLSKNKILQSIYPNAIKLGSVNIGNAIVTRSSVIIGALYLSLDSMASYGITIQLGWVLASVGTVYFTTFIPKIIQFRAQSNNTGIKRIYIQSCLFLILIFSLGGIVLILGGDLVLKLIGSKTHLLSSLEILAILVVLFFDYNRGMAEWMLSTKNEIPFFKASIFTGTLMLVILLALLKFSHLGVWCLILAPGIAQNCYQNWKWPMVVAKELRIHFSDISNNIKETMLQVSKMNHKPVSK